MAQKNYKGLPNIGATCYINSLLQTLFMTPEFRDGINEWTYNQKIHPRREDSILYQLQKLFAQLEMGATQISTKDLIKSFQWQDDQAFNQQDIQEFNRVLFEALQKSFANCKSNSRHLIRQLYQGEIAHFTKCLQCHSQSMKQQSFQDLILIIKNIYQKIYNGSIELSLQRYIKPQLLDQNNLYDCSVCCKKVRAQRGIKFIRLPKLLNIVLQRFHFDYYTMTKNKINDKFVFPFVLNFNNYFNGYEQIPNKLSEDSSQFFIEDHIPKKTVTKPPVVNRNKIAVKTDSTQPSVAGKIKTKPSVNTKSFLQEMRNKKMQQSMQNNEDLIFISGNATIHEQPAQIPEPKPKIVPIIQQSTQIAEQSISIPKPPPLEFLNSIVPPTITLPFDPSALRVGIKKQSIDKSETMQKQLQKLSQTKEQLHADKIKNLVEQQAKDKQLIQSYLKDGPLVYQLYAILVHSGTSNAGHYFSYIKSFENDRWYVFNDYSVNQINIIEIQKTFGGSGLSNAYVLYYRLVEEEKYRLQYHIPDYIAKIIKEEEENTKIRQLQKTANFQNTLILKVYYQLGVKSIQILKTNTLQLLYQKGKQLFNIKIIKSQGDLINVQQQVSYIKQHNLRIRAYNPFTDTKLDTFTGRQHLTLQQLSIKSFQNFLLQIKADSQIFQQFQPGFISIRVALLQDNPHIISLDQKDIRLHKVSININSTMKQIEQVIAKNRKQILNLQDSQPICIIKRHQNDEYLYHQVINASDYYEKTIEQIGIIQSQILFVESDTDQLRWPKEFQNQIYRINVKFINAENLEHQTIQTDSRILLNQLKITLCALINQSVDETIIRRGNKSGLELKNGEASLKQNRFISGTTLYLEKGLPAKENQIRIQLFLASNAAVQSYNRLHQFQFITDVPVNINFKASQVKELFADLLKKQRGLQLKKEDFRIREKVNDKMGKIYRQRPMKEQQLIQKRQIAIELKEDKLQLRDYSIYIRVWDQLNWKLSQKIQIFISKNTTMKGLADQIHKSMKEKPGIITIEPQEMDICRILSIHKFNILDLIDMEYFGMMSQLNAFGEPLFVNADGLLYIVKQTAIEPRQLTKQEETIFGGKIKTVLRPTKGRAQTQKNVQKQKGIVIKVMEKQHQFQNQ